MLPYTLMTNKSTLQLYETLRHVNKNNYISYIFQEVGGRDTIQRVKAYPL